MEDSSWNQNHLVNPEPGFTDCAADTHSASLRSQSDDGGEPGGNAMSLVAAMCVGAENSDDRGSALREPGSPRWRDLAPSTLESFLRAFADGQVRQLQAVTRRFTTNLIPQAGLVPPSEPVCI